MNTRKLDRGLCLSRTKNCDYAPCRSLNFWGPIGPSNICVEHFPFFKHFYSGISAARVLWCDWPSKCSREKIPSCVAAALFEGPTAHQNISHQSYKEKRTNIKCPDKSHKRKWFWLEEVWIYYKQLEIFAIDLKKNLLFPWSGTTEDPFFVWSYLSV